jgi:photosystem II stability/assembly factor-like uncharacterized protein
MKKYAVLAITAGVALLLASQIHAQEISEKIEALNSMKFEDWKKTFQDYFKTKTTDLFATGQKATKGTGFKQVARQLWYYHSRLDKEGNVVNTDLMNWKAYKDFVKQGLPTQNESSSPQTANWFYGSPSNVRDLDSKATGIGRITFVKLDPNNGSRIFAGTPKGGLWRGTWDGTSVSGWTCLTDGLPNIGAVDLVFDPANSNRMFLVSGDKEAGVGTAPSGIGIIKTTDGGLSWTATKFFDDEPPTFTYGIIRKLMIDPGNYRRMWAVTTAGIYMTDDGWETFTNRISANFYDLELGKGTSGRYLTACTKTRVYQSSDSGKVWTAVQESGSTYSFSSLRAELAVSGNMPSNLGFYLWYVNGTFNSTTSTVRYYSGSTWTNKYSGTDLVHVYKDYCMAFNADPNNMNYVYAGGVTFKYSSTGGTDWIDLNQGLSSGTFTNNIHADNHCVGWDQGYLFIGNDGGVYNWQGANGGWRYVSDGMHNTQYYRISYDLNASYLSLAGAQDMGTHRGSQHVGCCDGMESLINYNATTTVYSSWQGGNVLRSTNSGDTWSNFFPSGFQNDDIWITPMAMHKTNPAIIALGGWNGVNGKIWVYNAGWTEITDARISTQFEQIAFAKSAPNVLYGINGGTLVKISDVTDATPTVTKYNLPVSGATWITVDPNNSAHVFVTIGGYSSGTKVYESTTSGSAWTNYSANLPNVPINCVIKNDGGNNELYVGTDIGVFVRLPGWSYWAPFMNGLPNTQVADLEISGTNLAAATYGRGRWFTALYGACIPSLSLTPGDDPTVGNVTGYQYYTAQTDIQSTRIVEGGIGTDVTYRAGSNVVLKDGFHAKGGNDFKAIIGGCLPSGPAPLGATVDENFVPFEAASKDNTDKPVYNYMKPAFAW